MWALVAVVADVEDAISSGDDAKRIGMLRRMTGLFTEQASKLNEAQISAFDEVILCLSRDIEAKARAELSAILADVPRAPRQVVRDLAFDPAVAVAGPILERSERLDDGDLVEIARQAGQTHLRAISRRRLLAEAVTDVIVERGDEVVVRDVAGNRGARFSQGGFRILTSRARQDAELTRVLTERVDVPEAQMAQLVAVAAERARASLAQEFGEGAAALAVPTPPGALPGTAAELTGAEIVVARRATSGLDEADVQTWLTSGEVVCATVALARIAGVPSAMAVNAYEAATVEPLLFLVRSVRFGWKTLKLFLISRNGRQPSAEELQSAFQAFQGLSVKTAQRVVRFTAAREKIDQPDAA